MSADPKQFREYAHDSWATHYGGVAPPWDASQYKALCESAKLLVSDEHARGVWSTYLKNVKPFYAGHCPRKFKQFLSEFVADHAMIAEIKIPIAAYRREVGEDEQAYIDKVVDERGVKQAERVAEARVEPVSSRHDYPTESEREVARGALRALRARMAKGKPL